ncbi:hypothetical protein D3C74_411700 [compost metagenome]
MPSASFSPLCRICEKLSPASSAASLSHLGRVQFLVTALLAAASLNGGMKISTNTIRSDESSSPIWSGSDGIGKSCPASSNSKARDASNSLARTSPSVNSTAVTAVPGKLGKYILKFVSVRSTTNGYT